MLQKVIKPKQLFRGGPESAMLKGLTAVDVLKYEQEELGNKDVVPESGIDLTKIKSENLAWFTETEDQAREYGEACKSDLKEYRVIARDSEGGVLIEELKSSMEELTCIDAFKQLCGKQTCFGWEEPLVRIFDEKAVN